MQAKLIVTFDRLNAADFLVRVLKVSHKVARALNLSLQYE